ncbi:hypothetical protein C8R43DRAFT_951746 [Mycena crocata]|nr:hypothetical protein C8R43DRAFT_951746 [Mycena crocata]
MLFKANIFLTVLTAGPLAVYASVYRTVNDDQSLVNATRSVGNHSITALVVCQASRLKECDIFCDDDAQQTAAVHGDCYEDCEDDLCDFVDSGEFEFPLGSGTLVNFSSFRDTARDTKLVFYASLQSSDPSLGPTPDSFCTGCHTAEDWAALAGRPSPKGIIAQLALKLTCAVGCALVCFQCPVIGNDLKFLARVSRVINQAAENTAPSSTWEQVYASIM